MSNLIYIMGKSASGKDTIFQKIKNRIYVNTYVPYTTRPKRDGETNGIEYYFITREQFIELKNQGKVMENRDYNVINSKGEKDIWTYTTIDDEQWRKPGNFLSIGTLESYNSILKYIKNHPEKNINLLPVYIKISEEERRRRAINRENNQAKPNFEEMERRLNADNIDFSDEKIKEAGITDEETFENYNLGVCTESIINYIKSKQIIIRKEIEEDER